MKPMLVYIFGVAVCSGLFALLYSQLLERHVRFAVCRAYLLLSTVAAAVIPALRIPVWRAPEAPAAGIVSVGNVHAAAEIVPAAAADTSAIIAAIYFAGVLVLIVRVAVQLLRMRALAAGARRTRIGSILLLEVDGLTDSFSFFGRIFISRSVANDDRPLVIAHEAAHIRHHHSSERLAMEFVKTVLWWNPFAWLAARRLSEVHEFEADSDVLNNGYDVTNYINTLLKHLFGYSPEIANGLRDSLTKKRLKMMTINRSGRYALLRTLAVIPTVGVLMASFSFTAKAARTVPADKPDTLATIENTVVILDRKPLVIIDGKPADMPLEQIDASTITSITILKNDEAKQQYASLGDVTNDVVVVTTGKAPSAAEDNGTPTPYAEQMPVFGDGDLHDFRSWVMERIRFPQEALEAGVHGRVITSFVIGRDGSLGDIQVLSSPDDALAAEVVRVLRLSPRWTPGMQNGKTVNVKYTMPMDFAVRNADGSLQSETAPLSLSADNSTISKITVIGYGK